MENRRIYERCLASARSYFSEATRIRKYNTYQALGFSIDELEPASQNDPLARLLLYTAILNVARLHGLKLQLERIDTQDLVQDFQAACTGLTREVLLAMGLQAAELSLVASHISLAAEMAGFRVIL
jgi:hypothetical protein